MNPEHSHVPLSVAQEGLGLVPPSPATARQIKLSALLQRIARRDESAFSAFYDETVGQVYGVAVRMLRSQADAEEVTEETFFRFGTVRLPTNLDERVSLLGC